VFVAVFEGVNVGPPGVIVGVGVALGSASFATNASLPPFAVTSGPINTGKLDSVEFVKPTMYAASAESTAIPCASSLPDPPMNPAESRPVPSGATFATNASPPPLYVRSGPPVSGNVVSSELVNPAT
jgi:hypothetical protein